MDAIANWWESLSPLNRGFYTAAVFFGVFFLYQLLATVVGLGGDGDADASPDHDPAHTGHDPAQSALAFKLISVRSIIAFCTLLTWAAALYLNNGMSPGGAIALGVLWGLIAMVGVSFIVHTLSRLSYSGTIHPDSCIGEIGSVYLDIPPGGTGEVRVLCKTVISHFKARAVGGVACKAGEPVRIVRVLGPNTVEVEAKA